MTQPNERYYIDERTGCLAVRDRLFDDSEENGLHPDMDGVIRYWSKQRVQVQCSTCGHCKHIWDKAAAELAEARVLCDDLNRLHKDKPMGEFSI